MYRLTRLRGSHLLTSLRQKSDDILKNLINSMTLSQEDKEKLRNQLDKLESDTRNQTARNQIRENVRLIERRVETRSDIKEVDSKTQELARQVIERMGKRAERTLRFEVYSHATTMGLKEDEARRVSDIVVQKAAALFEEKANQREEELKAYEATRKAEEDKLNEKEKQILNYAQERIKQIFDPRPQQKEFRHDKFNNFNSIMADPNAKKIFGDKQAAMKYFDSKNMKSAPTSYWDELENCKVDIVNLWNLPKNAFEEQILWTEQGKMWPYPIDNEYLLGEEDNVNFTEHIFLDRYLAKHKHLPKDGPIAHFMELVCVGLSKNPYMTLAKKHMHLDSFAEFFNPEQIKRVHVLHEQAKKEAL